MLLLQGHRHRVRALAFSGDGQLLASAASHDPDVWVWDGNTGQLRDRLQRDRYLVPEALVAAQRGTTLAALANQSYLTLYDLGTLTEKHRLDLPRIEHYVGHGLAFSPDGTELAAIGSFQGKPSLYFCNVESGELSGRLPLEGRTIRALAWEPAGQLLAVANAAREVQLWKRDPFRQQATLPHPDGIYRLTFSADGRTLAVLAGNAVHLWNVESLRLQAALHGHTAAVWSLAFTPDGRQLATAGADGTVKLWDVASGRERASFAWQIGRVYSVAFSPDGMRAAAGGERDILIWDVDDF